MKLRLYALLFLLFVSANSFGQEVFRYETGFSVTQPKDWFFMKHKLVRGLQDKHGWSIITYYLHHSADFQGINPTIYITGTPNIYKTYENFEKKFTRRHYNKQLNNYSINEKPKIIEINGFKVAYDLATYIVTIKNKEYKVQGRSYVFYQPDYLYRVTLIDDSEGDDHSAIITELLKSIKIEPAKA